MIKYLLVMMLAALPVSEVRGAIIYGLSSNLNLPVVFILSVLVNIGVIPVIFWFLQIAHFRSLADKLFGQKMSKAIEKNKHILNKYGILGLLIFVAVPLPVTGAWTGTFIAEILKMNRKSAFLVMSLGVLIAAFLVTLGFGGTMFLIDKLV